MHVKSFILILLAAWLVCGTAFAEDGLRVAHVDSKLIFEGYKGTKKAQEEYDRQVAKWEQQANLLQKELAAIKEKLDKQALMLSDEKRKELEADYAKKNTELKDKWSYEYNGSIVCKGKMFYGTRIYFGEERYQFTTESLDHCRIYWEEGNIINVNL